MMYRIVTPAEAGKFRAWAQDNFDPKVEPNSVWHPLVKAEWYRLLWIHHDAIAQTYILDRQDYEDDAE